MTNCNYDASVMLLEGEIREEKRSRHTYESVSNTSKAHVEIMCS